jgi:hypothetical protein
MLKIFWIVLTPSWRRTNELKKKSDRDLEIARRFMTSWPIAVQIKTTTVQRVRCRHWREDYQS